MKRGSELVAGASAASAETARGGLGPAEGSHNSVGNIFYGPKGYLAIDNASGYSSWMGKRSEAGSVRAIRRRRSFWELHCLRGQQEKGRSQSHYRRWPLFGWLVGILANVSYRLGRTLNFDPIRNGLKNDEEANFLLRDGDRGYRSPFVVPEHI